jgi:rubredoxin
MIKHICDCGYIYNPKYGDITADIEPGIKFDDLPDKWLCPFCGLGKERFHDEEKKTKAKFVSFR